MANNLPLEKQFLILSSLVEGSSVRSIERITGVHRDTILRLMVSAGQKAQDLMDTKMVGLQCRYVQVDEIWTFVGKKQKRVTAEENPEMGDQYVFVAIDDETKLVPAFQVGKRDGKTAQSFISDLATRITSRIQLSTDSFKPYFNAIDRTFGADIDYAMLHKNYAEPSGSDKRYSPANIISIEKIPMIGAPKRSKICTSHIERQNLTMRMQMRRFTRLTNAFSKKLDNLKAAVALHFFHYNFMRIHQTLRVTPAMQAGISKHILEWEELLGVSREERLAA